MSKRIIVLSIVLSVLLFGALYVSLTAFAQDPQITIQCGANLRPVAELQADGAVQVKCKATVSPTPTPTPTPTPPPTTQPPPSAGKVWDATPSTLQSLIGKGSQVKPGDVVRLMPGTYLPPKSQDLPIFRFEVHVAGVTIKGQPGAILDGIAAKYGALYIAAEGVTVEDVEVTNSLADRGPERGAGVEVAGSNVTLRRLRVHDCGNGIFASESALSLVIEDCLTYNNGWQGPPPDRAHGHGIYAQNANSVKVIRRNISINNYGAGIHLFGQRGRVDNFLIEENIVANNGRTNERQVLIGGQEPSQGIRFNRNFVFTPLDAEYQPNVFLGYRPGNLNFEAVGNWFIGGTGVYVVGWERLKIADNVIVSKGRAVTFDSPDWRGEWAGNATYSPLVAPFASQGGLPVQVWPWDEWRANTRESGTFSQGLPVTVQWAKYENSLAVWNPTARPFVYAAQIGARKALDPVTLAEVKECGAAAFCAVLLR